MMLLINAKTVEDNQYIIKKSSIFVRSLIAAESRKLTVDIDNLNFP